MIEEQYKRQIKGLILILKNRKESMVSREYVLEKLQMILRGGINFHPVIAGAIDDKEI